MDGFDIGGIDETIHGRVRLGVMAFLSTAEEADFPALRARLKLTDGNLSVHLSKLEAAGYVGVEKRFVGKKPNTRVRITDAGRAAFVAYLDSMARLVDEARGG